MFSPTLALTPEKMATVQLILVLFLVTQTIVLQVAGAGRNTFKGDTYTDEELKAISKLRDRVGGALSGAYTYENKYFIRFLRARRMNLDSAERMIRDAQKWRQSENMDTILSEDFTRWEQSFPFYFIYDYNGRPGMASGVGGLNFRKYVLAGRVQEVMRYIYYALEKATVNGARHSNETGIEYNNGYLLFNLAGFHLGNHFCTSCVPYWISLARIYEGCYPQLSSRIIVINAPRLFVNGLNSVRPYISQITQNALVLYGFNKEEFRRDILNLFPPEMVTPEFGGTRRLSRVSVTSSRPRSKLSRHRDRGRNTHRRGHHHHRNRDSSEEDDRPSAFSTGFHADPQNDFLGGGGVHIPKDITSLISGISSGGIQSAVQKYNLASILGTPDYNSPPSTTTSAPIKVTTTLSTTVSTQATTSKPEKTDGQTINIKIDLNIKGNGGDSDIENTKNLSKAGSVNLNVGGNSTVLINLGAPGDRNLTGGGNSDNNSSSASEIGNVNKEQKLTISSPENQNSNSSKMETQTGNSIGNLTDASSVNIESINDRNSTESSPISLDTTLQVANSSTIENLMNSTDAITIHDVIKRDSNTNEAETIRNSTVSSTTPIPTNSRTIENIASVKNEKMTTLIHNDQNDRNSRTSEIKKQIFDLLKNLSSIDFDNSGHGPPTNSSPIVINTDLIRTENSTLSIVTT